MQRCARWGWADFQCTVCKTGFVKAAIGDWECSPCADATYSINSTAWCRVSAARKSWLIGVYVRCTLLLCPQDNFWQSSVCHARPVTSRGHPSEPENISGKSHEYEDQKVHCSKVDVEIESQRASARMKYMARRSSEFGPVVNCSLLQ